MAMRLSASPHLEPAWDAHERLYAVRLSVQGFHMSRGGPAVYHLHLEIGCYSFVVDRRYSEFRALHRTLVERRIAEELADFPMEDYVLCSRERAARRRLPHLARYVSSLASHELAMHMACVRNFCNLTSSWKCIRDASSWARLTFQARLEKTLSTSVSSRQQAALALWRLQPAAKGKAGPPRALRLEVEGTDDDISDAADGDLEDEDMHNMLHCTTLPVYSAEGELDQDLQGFEDHAALHSTAPLPALC